MSLGIGQAPQTLPDTGCGHGLTKEERKKPSRCDSLVFRNMVWQPCKARPDRSDHNLNDIASVNRLDSKPEHG